MKKTRPVNTNKYIRKKQEKQCKFEHAAYLIEAPTLYHYVTLLVDCKCVLDFVQLMLDLKPVKEIAYFNKITIDLPKPTAEVYTLIFLNITLCTLTTGIIIH